jgi:hypothetical protein
MKSIAVTDCSMKHSVPPARLNRIAIAKIAKFLTSNASRSREPQYVVQWRMDGRRNPATANVERNNRVRAQNAREFLSSTARADREPQHLVRTACMRRQ